LTIILKNLIIHKKQKIRNSPSLHPAEMVLSGGEQMVKTKPMTTGQAARYCHVSQATIVNWIKDGKLKAYATPGGHYRIPLPDFLLFLKTYEMPVDSNLRSSSRPQVLVVSDDSNGSALVRELEETDQFEVTLANNGYEAGVQMARLEPHAVVLDMRNSAQDWAALCRWLRASPEGRILSVLAIGDPENENAARAAGADIYLPSSAFSDTLQAELEALLTSKQKEH
jgi:excisionase family DNA binding protein